ncbi:MAG: hypothetical protein MSS83_04620 [Methanobrevibacter sp.]|uniref:hypothetical protein n=1 Tax=Methanobrevibacter TaxID=2172 RepID=UPI0026EFD19E|nr:MULTISPECIES: hypothetical protein [Methanobrevibacter]MCI7428371.1 hypothetical protein [Methanobrevibacter sp.]MDY3097591.1 hypothetical protein [Methanobrevibacter sp.]
MNGGKVTKTQYDKLKNSYLAKNRTLHSLYVEINEETPVNQQLFFKLINKIRQEEGLSDYYTIDKKKKREAIL